jgi:hypothetical protein
VTTLPQVTGSSGADLLWSTPSPAPGAPSPYVAMLAKGAFQVRGTELAMRCWLGDAMQRAPPPPVT